MYYNKDSKLLEDNYITIGNSHQNQQQHKANIMRLVARNRRTAVFGFLCVITLTMLVFKFNEFRPTCLLREESMMVRDEVSEILSFPLLLIYQFRHFEVILSKLFHSIYKITICCRSSQIFQRNKI